MLGVKNNKSSKVWFEHPKVIVFLESEEQRPILLKFRDRDFFFFPIGIPGDGCQIIDGLITSLAAFY